jgi:hypothetical protein
VPLCNPCLSQLTVNSAVNRSVTWIEPRHARRRVAAVYWLATIVALAALPLGWHQREVAGPRAAFRIVTGFDVVSWLVVIALICTLLGARFFFRSPGFYTKWTAMFVALATTIGIFSDYIDAESRAAQPNPNATPYNGPGFYLGIALVVVLIVATVLAWRTAEPL